MLAPSLILVRGRLILRAYGFKGLEMKATFKHPKPSLM
jgi:hypothetical protein